jgi:antirestriction protein ArdC
MANEIHDKITALIIAGLESATSPTEWPWVRAAAAGLPVNVASGKAYQGINRMVLGMAMAGGATAHWGTFKQWQEKGAQIAKGSKSTPVIYWGDVYLDAEGNRTTADDPEGRKRMFAKSASVFHSGQVEGWEAPAVEPSQVAGAERIEHVEEFVYMTGAQVFEGGAEAYYRPGLDQIQMPARSLFKDTKTASATEHFYSTLMHELVHWTGHAKRCNRDLTGRFGNAAYAFEELVAEIGSAFLAADLGLAPEPRADNLRYVASWLEVLKGDATAIGKAATLSKQAADHLHGKQGAKIAEAA